MLGARSVAVVGASARPGSFGERLVTEVLRSPSAPEVHLVNPRYDEVAGRPCVPSLRRPPDPVDLVLLGGQRQRARGAAAPRGRAGRPVGGGVRLGVVATGAGPVAAAAADRRGRGRGHGAVRRRLHGLRQRRRRAARPRLPRARGPAGRAGRAGHALAGRRSRRCCAPAAGSAAASAVSSGQELVTTTADYLEHALDQPETRVVALVLETLRDADRLRAALDRAAAQDVPVVLLAVGGTPAGAALVTAHSGALAGSDARVGGADRRRTACSGSPTSTRWSTLLELLAVGRRAVGHGPGTGLATVHDSGAERVLVADIAAPRRACRSRRSRRPPRARLASLLDPGLEAGQPAGRLGHRRRHPGAVRGCADAPWPTTPRWRRSRWPSTWSRSTTATTPTRGPCSTRCGATDKPVVVLANVVERGGPGLGAPGCGTRASRCSRAPAAGCARSGTCWPWPAPGCRPVSAVVDAGRRDRWLARLRHRPAGPGGVLRAAARLRHRHGRGAGREHRGRGGGRRRPGRLPGGPQDRRAGGAQVRRRRGGARPAGRGGGGIGVPGDVRPARPAGGAVQHGGRRASSCRWA